MAERKHRQKLDNGHDLCAKFLARRFVFSLNGTCLHGVASFGFFIVANMNATKSAYTLNDRGAFHHIKFF